MLAGCYSEGNKLHNKQVALTEYLPAAINYINWSPITRNQCKLHDTNKTQAYVTQVCLSLGIMN